MSEHDSTYLDDAVYIHSQLAFQDAEVKAEVAGNGRIQLYIGPMLFSLSVPSAETLCDLLDDAITTAKGVTFGPVHAFKVLFNDQERTADLKLVTE